MNVCCKETTSHQRQTSLLRKRKHNKQPRSINTTSILNLPYQELITDISFYFDLYMCFFLYICVLGVQLRTSLATAGRRPCFPQTNNKNTYQSSVFVWRSFLKAYCVKVESQTRAGQRRCRSKRNKSLETAFFWDRAAANVKLWGGWIFRLLRRCFWARACKNNSVSWRLTSPLPPTAKANVNI